MVVSTSLGFPETRAQKKGQPAGSATGERKRRIRVDTCGLHVEGNALSTQRELTHAIITASLGERGHYPLCSSDNVGSSPHQCMTLQHSEKSGLPPPFPFI